MLRETADYTIAVLTHPSPVAPGNRYRYPESDPAL
jgi:hypothetical protein